MPKVNIEYDSPLDAEATFAKVKEMLNSDADLRAIDSSIKFNFDDKARCGSAQSTKFKADINVSDQGSCSAVSIVVDLPFLLGAFKGQVKSSIEKKLAKILA